MYLVYNFNPASIFNHMIQVSRHIYYINKSYKTWRTYFIFFLYWLTICSATSRGIWLLYIKYPTAIVALRDIPAWLKIKQWKNIFHIFTKILLHSPAKATKRILKNWVEPVIITSISAVSNRAPIWLLLEPNMGTIVTIPHLPTLQSNSIFSTVSEKNSPQKSETVKKPEMIIITCFGTFLCNGYN